MSDTSITEGMMERAAQHLLSKPQTTVEGAVITFMDVVTDEVIALERRLKAAEAENAVLRGGAERVTNLHIAAVNLYLEGAAELEAKNAALREDAERYRWLRKFDIDSMYVCGKENRLDKSIDAARKE